MVIIARMNCNLFEIDLQLKWWIMKTTISYFFSENFIFPSLTFSFWN